MLLTKGRLVSVLLLVAGVSLWIYSSRPLFPDLQGPALATRLPEATDYSLGLDAFPEHGSSAMALLLTDSESSWYGLASGMSSMGIPFRIVRDAREALQHQTIMVYPVLSGANLAAADLQALAAHVRKGGTLLAFSVLGGGMAEIFGFESAAERPLHQSVAFASTAFSRPFVDTPAAALIQLGSALDPESGMPGVSYLNSKHPPIAVFDDASAAITHNFFEAEGRTGHAYALGLDLGHFILRAHNGRLANAADSYVNAYQPKIDTLLRFIATVYQQGEPNPLLLSPTPGGKALTILMTHDIDFTRSIINAPVYAEAEQAAGVPATYFIQTKYIKDYSDDYFLDPERSIHLHELKDMGMEIASHSVAHAISFETMTVGTGNERYPEYRPFVQNASQVRDATISGELRVSKFLLEALTGDSIVSFRPGHLAHPQALPQMLAATGYRYSSSMTANEALTHLPFRVMYDRSFGSPVPVFEFPVTIEDEEGILGERIDAAIELARDISRYRGLVNVLVHTDSVDHKLEFTRRFIAEFRDTAWFDTMGNFGDWWSARESVAIQLNDPAPNLRVATITVEGSITGLTLELPAGWTLHSGPDGSGQQGKLLNLGKITRVTRVEFRVDSLGNY